MAKSETLEDYANELFKEIQVLKKQLQQYKSIVKSVDPDNLPEDEVLAFDGDDTMAVGRLYFYSIEETIMCVDGADEPLFYITHYIETKDIIKMMGDL